jgi:hypothetical protein
MFVTGRLLNLSLTAFLAYLSLSYYRTIPAFRQTKLLEQRDLYFHTTQFRSKLILGSFKQRFRLEKSKGFDSIILTLNPNLYFYC